MAIDLYISKWGQSLVVLKMELMTFIDLTIKKVSLQWSK